MSRLLSMMAIAAAGLALTGCAHQETSPNLNWTFQADSGDGAKLAYGQPQSDNVVLMMTCEPGVGQVVLSTPSASLDNAVILGRDRFEGRAIPDALSGGQIVEATASAAAPSLDAFARTGDLTLVEGGRRFDLTAAPREQDGVKRFFESCRA